MGNIKEPEKLLKTEQTFSIADEVLEQAIEQSLFTHLQIGFLFEMLYH